MPNKCCVPGCQSNYKGNVTEGYVTVFKFPEESSLKQKWIKNIPRKNWTPGRFSFVCIKHFAESDLDRKELYKDSDGNQREFMRKKPVLVKSAVPSIFPNLPSYLTKPTVTARKDPSVKRLEWVQNQDKANEEWLNDDIVAHFQSFVENYKSKLSVLLDSKKCVDINCGDTVAFLAFDLTVIPRVSNSIKIESDMSVQVVVNGSIIAKNDLLWILSGNGKLNYWSQLENLIIRYLSDGHT